jgi:hypothetical protein
MFANGTLGQICAHLNTALRAAAPTNPLARALRVRLDARLGSWDGFDLMIQKGKKIGLLMFDVSFLLLYDHANQQKIF